MKHEHKIISRIAICFSMVLCMLLSTACKRSSDGQDFLGMRVVSAPEGFYVVNNQFSSSPKPATFATASSSFVATLSHEVTWTITIRGVVSGAEKTIVKTSKDINESWDGNSSNIFFFRKGEKAVAELSFMGSGLILKDEIIISSAIVYDNKTVNAVKYTLVDDFDGKGAPLLSISKDAFDTGVIMSADSTQKVQGLYAFKMAGYDASKNGWCGGVTSPWPRPTR